MGTEYGGSMEFYMDAADYEDESTEHFGVWDDTYDLKVIVAELQEEQWEYYHIQGRPECSP
jgi:hypothetical protein